MSSILKALKQLETETSDSDKSSSIQSPKRSHWFSGRAHRRNRIVWVLFLVLLFFVSTAGFLWYRKSHRTDGFPPDIPPSDAKSEVTEKEIFRKKIPGTTSKPAEKTATAVPISENRRVRKATSATTRPKASQTPINRRSVPTDPAASEAPVSARAPVVKKQKSAQPPAVSAPQQNVSRSPSSVFTRSEENSSPPKFTDSNYTLQAIAWSKNPKERLAIINGKILREGQSIEDITVSQIRENEVILLKNSGRWKLSFQAR